MAKLTEQERENKRQTERDVRQVQVYTAQDPAYREAMMVFHLGRIAGALERIAARQGLG